MIQATIYNTAFNTPLSAITRIVSMEATRRISGIGSFALVALRENIDFGLVPDLRIVITRIVNGKQYVFGSYFLRGWKIIDSKDATYIVLRGVCYNELLARRIVAYYSGSAQAKKTGAADNLMRAVVRENLGALAGSDRDISNYGFSVENDSGMAQSITVAFAYQQTIEALDKIAEIAKAKNLERLFYDFTPDVTGWGATFKIGINGYVNNGVVLDVQNGTLEEHTEDFDAFDEVNYVYAGDEGVGSERLIRIAQLSERVGASVLNRRERFLNVAGLEDDTVSDAINNALAEGYPKHTNDARVAEGVLHYGIDYAVGHVVNVSRRGYNYDAIIRSASLRADSNSENIDIVLEEL